MSSPTAIAFFAATIILTLLITVWASRRAKGRAGFYVASGKITGLQNGLAIAGDFLSATTFLGITGMYFETGVDPSSIYYLTPLVGFCLLMLWIAGPLKRAGKFTLGDVMTSRLGSPMLRLYAGVSTIVISIFYLVGQLVGAGGLVSILFGLPFAWAVALVGVLMTIYVSVGGMVAATWVQIIKALLLIVTVAALGATALAKAGGIGALYDQAAAAHPLGAAMFMPGAGKLDLFSAVSLAFGMSVGILGLPHLLIRFFTVPDEKAARTSAFVATLVAGGVFIVLFAVIGPATNAFVRLDPRFHDHAGALTGGSNMAAIHLANALGGQTFMGIAAAVAFATILAVVSGLVMSMASAASHDIYGVLRRREAQSEREELLAFRLASVGIAILAICLALAFQHYNVAFLTTLAFGIAVSANFPVLILVLYWRRLTVAGALSAGFFGLALSTALTVLGPAVWVKLLHHSAPLFPSDYPGLLVAPLTFLVAVAVSSRASVGAVRGAGAPAFAETPSD
jgi:cation/acetate symporter